MTITTQTLHHQQLHQYLKTLIDSRRQFSVLPVGNEGVDKGLLWEVSYPEIKVFESESGGECA